VAFGVLVG